MLVSLPSQSNRPPVTKFRVCNGSICTRRERVKARIAWSRLSVQKHLSMHTKRTGATGFPISLQFVSHFAVRMSSRHQLCFSATKMSPVGQGGLRSFGGLDILVTKAQSTGLATGSQTLRPQTPHLIRFKIDPVFCRGPLKLKSLHVSTAG